MPYIAIKPCEFGGVKYRINDLIPDDVVAKPKKLIKEKVIAPQKGDVSITETKTDSFMFPILTKDGFVTQEVAAENLLESLIIVQKNADEAKKAVKECENQEVLMLVYALDSRKGVKEAIDKRTAALEAEAEEAKVEAEAEQGEE